MMIKTRKSCFYQLGQLSEYRPHRHWCTGHN